MRHAIFAAGTVMLVLVLLAPGAMARDDGAPSAFFPQTRYEFAPVLDGEKVVHEFVIQNKGTRPLNVQRVKTG